MDPDRAELNAAGAVVARSAAWRAVTIGVPMVFLGVLFAWPVANILTRSLTGADADLTSVLAEARTWRIVWFTTWQAIASTALTLAVGLPGAWLVSRVQFRGRALFRSAVTVPFVLPTVVVASAFIGLLGPATPLNRTLTWILGRDEPVQLIGSVGAILLAHLFFNYAVVVRTVAVAWDNLDPSAEHAARALGASPWRAFRNVTWPRLRASILAAASIVFLFTFTSFGVMLLLGRGRLITLEVEIYRATADRLDLDTAAVLALLQLAAVVSTLILHGRLSRRTVTSDVVASRLTLARPRSLTARWWLRANLVVAVALVTTPLLALIERSLDTAGGYGLTYYRSLFDTGGVLFVSPAEAIYNSLLFALIAAGVALVVGAMAAASRTAGPGRLMDRALMLPLGTSAVTIGFGMLITLDSPPFDLRSSFWIVPLGQALVATPFVVRILVPALDGIDPRTRAAAAVLGASPHQVWRHIDLPIAFRAGVVAYGFALAISLGEFGATAFIARVDRPTLPIAIFRLLGQPGALNMGRAMAMSVVLMMVTMMVTWSVDRVRVGQLGAF